MGMVMEVKTNVFNDVKEGEYFYLPDNCRCIRIVPIIVWCKNNYSEDYSEKVNYFNLFSGKFGYLSGLETVNLCDTKGLSLYVNICGIEH